MMTPKKYLSRIRWMNSKIDHALEELAEYKAKMASVSAIVYDKDIVQSSPSNDALPNAMSKITSMEREIDVMVDAYVEQKHEMIKQIDGMQNDLHRDLLYERYVNYKKLGQIAEEMNYTLDWIKHAHGRALQAFGEKYEAEIREEYERGHHKTQREVIS